MISWAFLTHVVLKYKLNKTKIRTIIRAQAIYMKSTLVPTCSMKYNHSWTFRSLNKS